MAARVAAADGTDIFGEGEPAGALYNLTGGTVKLYKLLPDGRRQITGFLFPGDFLGLAMNEAYAHTAEAVGDVTLCRFPRGRFEGLLERLPRLEHRLLEMASNELAQAQDQMLLLGRKTATEKIASFLLLLSRRQAARGEPASPVRLPMGRADIADYLGLTVETVSRCFTALKTGGPIRLLTSSAVELRDRAALEALAEGG
ncbi:MAG: cyclic nucleotide-binding domain-containing protein [Alphaproteobacteria bacterium]